MIRGICYERYIGYRGLFANVIPGSGLIRGYYNRIRWYQMALYGMKIKEFTQVEIHQKCINV